MMKLVLITCFWALAMMVNGQSFKGEVIDASNQEGIAHASVYIIETKSGLITNENGVFTLEEDLPNTVTLQISHIGYQELIKRINLLTESEMVFELEPSHISLDEVSVSVAAGKLGRENVVEVDRRNMAELQNGAQSSLVSDLANLPGLDQVSTSAGIGKPVIRGLSGNRIVTYSQGIRLENQQFGDEHGLGESANGVEAIEVIKGPASLLYGADAIGGVLYLVDEKFAYHHETHGHFASEFSSNALTTANNFGVKTNIGEVHWNVFGAFTSTADYEQGNEIRAFNTRFNELSFKTALGFHAKNYVGNVRYGLLSNKFGIPEGEDEPSTTQRMAILPSQDIKHHTLSFENSFFKGNKTFVATLGYGLNQRKEFEDDFDAPALQMLLNTITYDFKAKLPFADESFELTTGLQGMFQRNENDQAAEEILIPNGDTNDVGAYGVLSYYPNGATQVQGGVRFDKRGLDTEAFMDPDVSIPALKTTFNSFNASFGASHNVNQFTLRANVASGFRPPTLAELLSEGEHEGSGRYERGNVNLNSEKALQFDVGVDFANDHVEIGFSPFFNSLDNYIFLQPTGGVIDGADVFEYTQAKAKLYGGEIGLHIHPHSIHWLHIESDVSTLWAEDSAGNYLPLIPHNKIRSQFRAEFEKSTFLKSVSATYQYKFNQNRASAFETQSDSYGLVNLAANSSLALGKNKLYVKAGIDNLLNNEYIDHLSRLKGDGVLNPGFNAFVGARLTF